jgi:alpha-tubulin suppressor-like RCC1 family protein
VAGDLRFRELGAIATTVYTCGLTICHQAYCWGFNRNGQLGDGTTIDRTTPVAVVGGLRFREISGAARHTCAITLGNRAYC